MANNMKELQALNKRLKAEKAAKAAKKKTTKKKASKKGPAPEFDKAKADRFAAEQKKKKEEEAIEKRRKTSVKRAQKTDKRMKKK